MQKKSSKTGGDKAAKQAAKLLTLKELRRRRNEPWEIRSRFYGVPVDVLKAGALNNFIAMTETLPDLELDTTSGCLIVDPRRHSAKPWNRK